MPSRSTFEHVPGTPCPDLGSLPDFDSRAAILREFLRSLRDPQERLAWIVERSRGGKSLVAVERTADNLVPGCAARLWLGARIVDGHCRFACDSDSAILKAAALLLCEVYDGLARHDVATGEPSFLEECGLLAQFTENRRRTIRRVRDAIRAFAEQPGRV